eukprot:snap_masked-scaffold_1-processed-gene-26.36-mRNA-1 protein AED:0.02 eAED:0.09 QI:0/-1/0/1/-1/1/1/0/435
MKIVVIGGGNSTLLLAPQAKLAGHHVSIMTRKPEKWSKTKEISFLNYDKSYMGGQEKISAVVDEITSDPAKCIPEADCLVFAGLPCNVVTENLEKMLPHLVRRNRVLYIGSICAYGGFNWQVSRAVNDMKKRFADFEKVKVVIFGFQAIPWSCGHQEYGHVGLCYGHKASLNAASELLHPSTALAKELQKKEKDLYQDFANILQIPLSRWRQSSFLVSTLYPNNPVFHPPIEYGLFKDWDMRTPLALGKDAPVHIYKDLTKESAEYMRLLNKEIVQIVHFLRELPGADPGLDDPGFDLLQSLIIAFGDTLKDTSSIYKAVRTNPAYQKYKNPYVVVGEKNGETFVKPNLQHRFYTSDVTVGLVTYKDMAIMCGIETPIMDDIILWHQKLLDKEWMVNGELVGRDIAECILPSTLGYGINNLHLSMEEVQTSKAKL